MDRKPLAQGGEMEATRKRHLVDREMNPRGKKRMSTDDDPRAGGGSSSDVVSSDALAAEKVHAEGEMTDESAAPTTLARSPSSLPSTALSEESPPYGIRQEMADRFIQIMADHAANKQLYTQQSIYYSVLLKSRLVTYSLLKFNSLRH